MCKLMFRKGEIKMIIRPKHYLQEGLRGIKGDVFYLILCKLKGLRLVIWVVYF